MMSVFGYGDPSELPLTAEQRARREEEIRRNMRRYLDDLRENPPMTMEEIAELPPEICVLCGEIAEAHWFDGERIHCPERIVN